MGKGLKNWGKSISMIAFVLAVGMLVCFKMPVMAATVSGGDSGETDIPTQVTEYTTPAITLSEGDTWRVTADNIDPLLKDSGITISGHYTYLYQPTYDENYMSAGFLITLLETGSLKEVYSGFYTEAETDKLYADYDSGKLTYNGKPVTFVEEGTGNKSVWRVRADKAGTTSIVIPQYCITSNESPTVKITIPVVIEPGNSQPAPKPTPAPTPAPKPVPVVNNYDKPESWNNAETTIRNELAQIEKNVAAGTAADQTISVNVGTQAVVPSNVLHMVKDSSATLAVQTGQGLAFSITGASLKNASEESLLQLNLKVNTNADVIPADVLATKTKDVKKTRQIDLAHNGAFGFNIGLHLAMGAENAGSWANLYHFNTVSNQLEYYGSFKITDNGQALFGLSHASTYLVTVTDKMPKEKAVKQTVVPAAGSGQYAVQRGDSLYTIAGKYHTTVAALLSLNSNIKNPNMIYAGQIINIG